VRAGETLWTIATRYGLSVNRLAELNHISSRGHIYPGQTLRVPAAPRSNERVKYVVRRGDTLTKIANEFNIAVSDLIEFNNIVNPQKIRATPGMMELLLADETQRQANQNVHGWALGAAACFNIEERLREIRAPTLVIQGAQDATFPPRWGKYYTEHIPNAVLRLINKTSHSIQVDQPEALAEAIVNFGTTLTRT